MIVGFDEKQIDIDELTDRDEFSMPKISLNVQRVITDLYGKSIKNKNFEDLIFT